MWLVAVAYADPPDAAADPVAALKGIPDFGARKQWLDQWVHAQTDPDRLIRGATAMKVLSTLEGQHRTDNFVVLAFVAAALDPATSRDVVAIAERGGDPPIVPSLTAAPDASVGQPPSVTKPTAPAPVEGESATAPERPKPKLGDAAYKVFHSAELHVRRREPMPEPPAGATGVTSCKVRVFLGADGVPREVRQEACPDPFFTHV
jgi:hypothetical protein